jgi:glycosyltransferase involved in cell wall biosynthesis
VDHRAFTARPIAYLVNRYPTPSHSFIRREIQALERRGIAVQRFSIRPPHVPANVVVDRAEAEQTTVVCGDGVGAGLRLLAAMLVAAVRMPLAAGKALLQAIDEGRRSDRGVLVHCGYFAEACWLALRLRGKVAHLHAHFGTNSAMVAMLASAMSGVPFSFTVHGPEEFDRQGGIGLRRKIARAQSVAAISDFCRSQLLRFSAPADWPKIGVVRCGLDAALLAGQPAPLPEPRSLLFVGRMHVDKGLPTLLAAGAVLVQRGIDFRLRLIGGGDELEDWQRQVQRSGLGARIEFLGWRDQAEIVAALDASFALVLPSLAEGLPVVLMEALARGRPVVTSRLAGIPELVRPGENGYLVTPGVVSELADALTAVLALDAATWQRMGAAGRRTVAALHDVDRAAAQLEQMFALAPMPGAVVAAAAPALTRSGR